MKISLNWLKQYIDIDLSPDQIAGELTMLGLEVESIDHQTDPFDGIVVARVESREQHPDADKLSVCQVFDGQGTRQIVCGARNFSPGDKVPLILPGHSLPPKNEDDKPFVIKVGKLRGVESQGMMCSGTELGLTDDSAGLMILDAQAEPGTPLSKFLGRSSGDVIFDLETTPNRPDWNSFIGIARELSAKLNLPLKVPATDLPDGGEPSASGLVDVRIDAPELCPRYSARIVRNVKVGPSPSWLVERLESIGIRSINNVVDVTNFVMMETGQPLHAFDFHLLQSGPGADRPCVVVRAAGDGELFTTLDEQERKLDSGMAVIADETRAIALAGVMGGLNSEISDSTRDVLVESAAFSESATRRTSKVLGLRTDASYRFERGTDWNMVEYAGRRAVALILETAGGEMASGVVDATPCPPEPRTVSLRFNKTDELLGQTIDPQTQLNALLALGLELTEGDASSPSATFIIPTNRPDLKREADLIEEVIRLYGINNVTAAPPRGAVGTNEHDAVHDSLSTMRSILVSMGLHEAQGQTLIGRDKAIPFCGSPVALEYPLSSDMDVLRPSLLPGLIDAMELNFHQKADSVALFETGRTFQPAAGDGTDTGPKEMRMLGVAISGAANGGFWEGPDRDRSFDFYDLKGLFEEFMSRWGLPAYQLQRMDNPGNFWVEAAEVRLGKNLLGVIGQLHPVVQKKRDIRKPAFLLELNVDLLIRLANRSQKFKPLPQYPSTSRDVALLVEESVTHDQILDAIRRAKVKILEEVSLFDVFRGGNVPEGRKSLAYTLTYRDPEKTLTDKEVQKAHDRIVESIQAQTDAVIR